MAIITLTTDFGYKDPWVGLVKGSILSNLPSAQIVDITHAISPFDILETGYIVSNSYHSFPRGSIHIIGVDSGIHPTTKSIAAWVDEHYFICPNNGVLSLITQNSKPKKVVELDFNRYDNPSFIVKDIFVPAACHLARKGNIDLLGSSLLELKSYHPFKPAVTENTIMGMVIYIDNYGNAITNISHQLFKEIGKSRGFEIVAGNYSFSALQNHYVDIIDDFENEDLYVGERLALFNDNGYLEIALYKSNPEVSGGAHSLLGLSVGVKISITFAS